MQLTKHHGLGNDFLVALDEVNGRGLTIDGELARRVCDRRTGIGADGLIHGAAPEPGSGVDVVMHLFNADGSRAEMSGNGIRCLAHAVALAREVGHVALSIQTDGGVHHVLLRSADSDDRSALAEATMGEVRPGPEVPPAVVTRLADPGPAHATRYDTADIGNPHLVVEVEDPDRVDLAEIGPWIERQFPDGINIEFVPPPAGPARIDIDMRVWERGAGATQACGTGACAVVAVLHEWDGSSERDDEHTVTVHMPGGDAQVTLLDDGTLVLAGTVHHVATIEVPDA